MIISLIIKGTHMTKQGTFSRLKEQEKHLRREIIMEAAEKQFAEKPFNRVNMRDIAKEAGISPASIYRYFPDQQSLFAEALARGTKQVIKNVNAIASSASANSIDDAAVEFIDFFTGDDQYFRLMINFMLEVPVENELYEKANYIAKSLLDEFDLLFTNLGATQNVRLISHAFFATLTGIMTTFRNYPGKSRDEIMVHRKRVAGIISGLMQTGIRRD